MTDTIAVHHIEEVPGGASLQVISIEDKLEGDRFFVRLAEGMEFEDTPFEDYPQAYAHWRNVLRTLGITVAYVAPVVEFIDFSAPADVRGAVEIYFEFHSHLNRLRAGTDEATAIRDKYLTDPEFIDNVAEILELAGSNGSDWVAATIRTACRRVMAREQMAHKKSVEEHLGGLSTFGAF
jgi:hypothetical protein